VKLNQSEPLFLIAVYFAFDQVANVLFHLAASFQSGFVSFGAFVVRITAIIGLILVVAWNRDEDNVAAGILVAITMTVTWMLTNVINALLLSRTVGTIFPAFMMGMLPGFFVFIFIAPASIVLVAFARFCRQRFRKRLVNR
jgi:hypothetical protein